MCLLSELAEEVKFNEDARRLEQALLGGPGVNPDA